MGRHAASILDWADYEADPAAYRHVPLEEIPTEPVPLKAPRGWVPAFIMFVGAAVAAVLLVVVAHRWPGHMPFSTGLLLIGLVVVPYLTAMLGMLLLHWRGL